MTDAMAMTQTASIRAIDVHAHVGWYRRGVNAHMDRFCSATAKVISDRARRARIRWTMVSPLRALLPRGHGDVLAGNEEARKAVASTRNLLMWAVLSPHNPASFSQVAELLTLRKCVGIKIHPEEHLYAIRREGKALFEFAARHRAVILTHSGEKNSMPAEFVKWADRFPEVRLILGHLGCGWDGDPTHQVRAVQRSKRGNVFVDTSSAMNVTPGLIEWAVGEIGAEKVLFGTDSPCYFAPMQRARIDFAELRDSQKRRILVENACALFGLKKG